MTASNYNTLFAVDSSDTTTSILMKIKPFAPYAMKADNPVYVSLITEPEMRTMCTRRNLPYQDAILVTRAGMIIDSDKIVPTIQNMAVQPTVLKTMQTPQRTPPNQISDENRSGQISDSRDQQRDNQPVESQRQAAPAERSSHLMTVGPHETASPARMPAAVHSMLPPTNASMPTMVMPYQLSTSDILTNHFSTFRGEGLKSGSS